MPIINTQHIYSGTINFKKCLLYIQINIKTYLDNKQYYYIDYDWLYNNIKDHPLYNEPNFIYNHNDGEIIFKNPLIDKMVELLIMDPKTENCLENKIKIIKALSLCWD